MRFFAFLILSFFYITPLFAQSLSPNPWVQKNTEQQIKKAYKKRDNRLSHNSSTNISESTQTLPTSNEDSSFLDNLKKRFSNPNKPIKNTHITPQKRITSPSKISSKRPTYNPSTIASTSAPSDPVVNSKGFSMPTFKTPSFSAPSMPSNSFINKTKQNFKRTLNQIKKQIN